MGVLDSQPVNQTITNAAFLSKNANDTMSNILSFARTLSGATIADIQAAVNKLYTATGASESQTGTVYNATAGTITNGQSYQSALTILADKFDAATGHMHTGAPGDGPILEVVNTVAASGSTPLMGDVLLVPGLNVQLLQSGQQIIISATGAGGVTDISASGYSPQIGSLNFIAGSGMTIAATGQDIIFSATGSGGVTSISASGYSPQTGALNFISGSGMTIAASGQDITFSASGGGSTITLWTPYTATTPTTNLPCSSTSTLYRQVGPKSIDIQGFFLASGAATGVILVAIPDTFLIDSSQLAVSNAVVGVGRANHAALIYFTSATVFDSSNVQFSGPNGQSDWSSVVPFVWGSGDQLQVLLTGIPIL